MSTSRSPCGSMRAAASTAPKPRPGMPLARNRKTSGTSSPGAVIRFGSGIGWFRRAGHAARNRRCRAAPAPHQTCCPKDLQASWLLLRYCAAPRANYLLQVLPPALSEEYAAGHDAAVARCLAQLLGYADAPLPEDAGLGLRCARADRHAAHWASWCDALPVVRDRAPQVAQRILQALHAPEAEQTPAGRATCSSLPTCAGCPGPGMGNRCLPGWGPSTARR